MSKKKSSGRDFTGRFQPGFTGNAAGRPPKAKTVGAAVAGAFAEKVHITENGKRRRVTKLDVTAKQIANRSAAGDARMVKLGLELAQKAEEGEGRLTPQSQNLNETDQQIADRLVARIFQIAEEKIHGRSEAASD
jgi:hypothetical protein